MTFNPFISAYFESDYFGKSIFIGLYLLSLLTWIILARKGWNLYLIFQQSKEFEALIDKSQSRLLSIELPFVQSQPFLNLFHHFKSLTIELLNKNRVLEKSTACLYSSDIDMIANHMNITIDKEYRLLQKHLSILSTVVTLAPFLGLLGTVWGILLSFGSMQNQTGSSNDAMLSGLAMALATTVLGLLVAIPALIGYNILRSYIQEIAGKLEDVAHQMLTSVELQYRVNSDGEDTKTL